MENKKIKQKIDIKEYLSLDNIMVLRIGPYDIYKVTMLGLNEDNNNERVLISNGQKENEVIKKCLQNDIKLERKSIKNYMPSDYIEIYNEALNTGNYECCITMIKGIEKHINNLSKERNEATKKYIKKANKRTTYN